MSKSNTEMPHDRCCLCGQPLRRQRQNDITHPSGGYDLLDCINPECDLEHMTVSESHYPPTPEEIAAFAEMQRGFRERRAAFHAGRTSRLFG